MFDFTLTFAGVPFITDVAKVFRLFDMDSNVEQIKPLARKQEPMEDLLDELDRLIAFCYQQDFEYANESPLLPCSPFIPPLEVGDWFYPPTARQWSVFRGLATSAQVKQMTALAAAGSLKPFIMQACPKMGDATNPANYKLESNLLMLPARPIGQHGSAYDGIFLVTLVDERYKWRNHPIHLKVNEDSTWTSLVAQIASSLGVTISVGTVAAVYGKPEPDSNLWTSGESAAVLLDLIGHNIGKDLVRSLDGTYAYKSDSESQTILIANRQATRTAGGAFFSTDESLKAGDISKARNNVAPSTIQVSFPKYVAGDTPYFVNGRDKATRWHESAFGDVYQVNVPIASGGAYSSGLVGQGTHSIRSTAKAILSTENDAAPTNVSGLNALAMQIAQDVWERRTMEALDEVYPGTLKLTLEGTHNVIWTYSERKKQACTRVVRMYWNATQEESQHATPVASGSQHIQKGLGGHHVAQTIKDGSAYLSGRITTTLSSQLASGGTTVVLAANGSFPVNQRWKAKIDSEVMLLEGTSGGTSVGVVRRAIDGTTLANHSAGVTVYLAPSIAHGVNLTTYENGQFGYPHEMTSGGLFGWKTIPQTQSVQVLSDTLATINGVACCSGVVQYFDVTKTGLSGSFQSGMLCWVAERNAADLVSGNRYDGQFVGYSASGPVAPIYLANAAGAGNGGPASGVIALNVKEADNNPRYSGIGIVIANQDNGFSWTEPVSGIGAAEPKHTDERDCQ